MIALRPSIVSRFTVLIVISFLTGCSVPVHQNGSFKAKSPAIADGPHGTVGRGIFATHFDRDGDGKYEECRRGEFIYFNTAQESCKAVVVELLDDGFRIKWSKNHDGILDHSALYKPLPNSSPNLCGPPPNLVSYRKIHEPVTRLFQEDRIQKTEAIPFGGLKLTDWISYILKDEPEGA